MTAARAVAGKKRLLHHLALVGGATALANLALGLVTILPASFVLVALQAEVFNDPVLGYDPRLYQSAGKWCAALIAVLFLATNITLHSFLPGRRWWLWAVALLTYPIPYGVLLWSSE